MYARVLLALISLSAAASAQDPRELVRQSIARDQLDWVHMSDYTWQAHSIERRLDPHGQVQSTKEELWETLILNGEPYRRNLERDGLPVSANEQRKEQEKLDRAAHRLDSETPEEKQHRLEKAENERKREFAFLSEVTDLFDLRLEGDTVLDGQPVWVVYGAPRPDAQPKSRDAKLLLKVRGRIWIDKATSQWAKVEAETTGTISWGLFLARLSPGAKMTFEQAPVDAEHWLPKRLVVSGKGRLGLVVRLSEEQEIEWRNYKKFSVDSKVIADGQ